MERLNAGEVVIGDGGFVFALEKRGYVKAGPWTPEATKEHPEAGMEGLLKAVLLTSYTSLLIKTIHRGVCLTTGPF